MVVELNEIFNSAVENSLFQNKGVLQTKYTPETIPHRDEEIKHIAKVLAPSLRGERPSNLFIYGNTGTGKTLSVQYVKDELTKKATELEIPVRFEYLNCKIGKVADTEYRILATLIAQLGGFVPATGLPTGQVWDKFKSLIDTEKQLLIIIFDELDQVVDKMGDNFLYTMTRLNQELGKAQISIVGISNVINFLDNLDPRVKSSLGEEDKVFNVYDGIQLKDILKERCSKAFKKGVIGEGVISKCAAYAAKEHGDARRALDLIRIAGELSEREGKKEVTEEFIDLANSQIETDKILDLIKYQPRQSQLILKSIIDLHKNSEFNMFYTGDVYNHYQVLCERTKDDILTQRRVSDIIQEFDMAGLINAKVISKGRHGRTKEIKLSIPSNLLEKVELILKDSLLI